MAKEYLKRWPVPRFPTDFIKIQQAQNAVGKLENAGAQTRLKTYNGGHGWTEDPYGNIKTGIKWLAGEK